jgi:hypothetical protein
MKAKGVKSFLGLINLSPRHENLWGSENIAPSFLTSGLDGGE